MENEKMVFALGAAISIAIALGFAAKSVIVALLFCPVLLYIPFYFIKKKAQQNMTRNSR
jgi:predicted membrane protein